MTDTDNALAIAELRGDRAAVRAEMQSMESRIDAGLAVMREDIAKFGAEAAKRDAEAAKRDAEAAKRETRLLLSVAGMIGLGVAVIGLIVD